MAAPKGNQYWRARSTHGRKPKFNDADVLWSACKEYFDWVEQNPLKEEKVFHNQGKITRATVAKMRAMTIDGLCLFLDIDVDTWHNYRKKKDLIVVTTRAEKVIRQQKFSGAAADLLNANIIARDLGLKDQREVDSSNKNLNLNKEITRTEDLDELTNEELEDIIRGP